MKISTDFQSNLARRGYDVGETENPATLCAKVEYNQQINISEEDLKKQVKKLSTFYVLVHNLINFMANVWNFYK